MSHRTPGADPRSQSGQRWAVIGVLGKPSKALKTESLHNALKSVAVARSWILFHLQAILRCARTPEYWILHRIWQATEVPEYPEKLLVLCLWGFCANDDRTRAVGWSVSSNHLCTWAACTPLFGIWPAAASCKQSTTALGEASWNPSLCW